MDVETAVQEILERSRQISPRHAMLVAISGVDGAGKGWMATKIAACLEQQDVKTTILSVDRWLNLPAVRFSRIEPAQHFYENAIRFGEMFANFLFPLKETRSIDAYVDLVEETATESQKVRCTIPETDVILLEGIYLFKKEFLHFYDLKIWIECDFETALHRAIARSQEGLSREETTRAYHTIYFPAQMIHFEKDRPQSAADLVIENVDN